LISRSTPQRFGHKLGQIDASLFGFPGELLHTPFDGDGHRHLAGRDMVKSPNPFAEVDPGRHVVIVKR